MRISELSRLSGVSVASIKYYIREGVLAAGESDGPNRATYGGDHLARLRLIRGLVDSAGVSIAGVKRIAGALDAGIPVNEAFGVAQSAVPLVGATDGTEPSAHATDAIRDVIHPHAVGHPAAASAARALDTFEAAGEPISAAWLERYAEAAAIVARADFDELERRPDPAAQARIVAVGTALGDVVFQSLRRIAQATEGERRFPSPPPASPPAV
ncbi:MerR family transcriptional regulator [Labedella endophytica]|uniref:MerR family transcriptional regulator n=1 Tax=Labedella endophytica TaxID=1523160 RepID=A0A433JUF7_9MICO|nr:MerR family transcriptional regulator [Labedella endophytica]RUR01791.1 MerR family transcriptional regulator [Labedella endophytica]